MAEKLTKRDIAKAATRQKLVMAAAFLFDRRGYRAVTVRDVAAAADLSTGALFANFAGKSDLFQAAFPGSFKHRLVAEGICDGLLGENSWEGAGSLDRERFLSAASPIVSALGPLSKAA